MRCYAVFPVIELKDNDARSEACIDLVTSLVVHALRADGDCFDYVVDWIDPGSPPGSIFHDKRAKPHVRQLNDKQTLIARVRASVDPFDSVGLTIRSIATCRAVTFGYDGQAFLCLRHEDVPPLSPEESLAVVKERHEFLTETDYFDGYVTEAQIAPDIRG